MTMSTGPILWFTVCCLFCAYAQEVLINEVNADNPDGDDQEYVELWNPDSCPKSLNGYRLVLFKGNTKPANKYHEESLDGKCIDGNGYFIVGSPTLSDPPDLALTGGVNIKNGNGEADAVFLYRNRAAPLAPSATDLVDSIIYDKNAISDITPYSAITVRDQVTVFEDETTLTEDESMSRCSAVVSSSSAFKVGPLTPRYPNFCMEVQEKRWPISCDVTHSLRDSRQLRDFRYKIVHGTRVVGPSLDIFWRKSAVGCAMECSTNDACSRFSYFPKMMEEAKCILYQHCNTNLQTSNSTIDFVGEKFYLVSRSNPVWPHEANNRP